MLPSGSTRVRFGSTRVRLGCICVRLSFFWDELFFDAMISTASWLVDYLNIFLVMVYGL